MAAAYAALVSLLNTMHQIQTHHLLSTSFNNNPNQSLNENIDFLLHYVENYSDADSGREAEDLLRRIAVVAHEAEDIIEVQAAHQIRAAASTQQRQTFWPNLQSIIDDMDTIKKQIFKIHEETGNHHHLLLLPPASSSSAPPPTPMVDNYSESESHGEIMQVQPADPPSSSPSTKTTKMVGFDRYLDQLLDQLTGHPL